MTFLEKVTKEHIEDIDFTLPCRCVKCPYMYNYESRNESEKNCFNFGEGCVDCWNRQMPEDNNIKEKEVKKSMNNEYEAVNHPTHYVAGGVECIDALKAATVELRGIEAVCTANAIKYLWRWKLKNGVQDLDKAIWYIERLKKEIDKSTNL